MQLFVKSQKVDMVKYTMPNLSGGGHWCSAGYRSQGVLSSYASEDEEALTGLRSKGVNFSLVDLSVCPFETRLKAKMSGVNKTPTLVLDNGTRIEGVNRIREHTRKLSARLEEKKE